MAHYRDYRQKAYFTAVQRVLGPDFASALSADGLDQVLYHPRTLVVSPPAGGDTGGRLDDVLRTVEERLLRSTAGDSNIERRPIAGWEELGVYAYEIPQGAVNDDFNSLQVAIEVDQEYPGQVAPLYYGVTQQIIQPGEDPERAPLNPREALLRFSTGARRADLGAGVRIAVLDTGIDPDAIAAANLSGIEYTAPNDVDTLADTTVASPTGAGGLTVLGPGAGHGTFIAGLIKSVAPGATVRSIAVASPMGVVSEERAVAGLREALEWNADVISLSFGGYAFSKGSSWPPLRALGALERAIALVPDGVAVVASAGNCGSNAPFYPAAFDGVVSVAALDRSGRLWDHSNYGEWVRACAFGQDVVGLFVKGDENPVYDMDGVAESWPDTLNYAQWTGTSFSAPLVAAQIALVVAEFGLTGDSRRAWSHLESISRAPVSLRPCGRRILVDLPGQV